MLIGFKVKNFRSFNEMQYFSMLAGKVRNNENHITEINGLKILKFAGMYGANGSGKSNLILSLSILKTLVEKGINSLINDLYFRGIGGNKDNNSYFEYEIALNDRLYSYGFELNIFKQEIVSEWLIDMTKNKNKVIFERDIKGKKFKPNEIDKKHPNFYNCLEEMKNNNKELFLKEMTRRLTMSNNSEDFYLDIRNIFQFLIYDTQIIRPITHKLFNLDYINKKDKILNILKALDINIIDYVEEPSDMKFIETKMPQNEYNNFFNDLNALSNRFKNVRFTLRIENCLYSIKKSLDNRYEVSTLKFIHDESENKFGTYDESDGTIRILELVDILLTKNKLFLIDELDSSLHPVLVEGFIKIFLNSSTNNQLIITTHESKVLDFDLVRRDEIWFAEKNKNGESKIYSLEEYKNIARFDKKIDKAYLEGRFGAIANLDDDYEI